MLKRAQQWDWELCRLTGFAEQHKGDVWAGVVWFRGREAWFSLTPRESFHSIAPHFFPSSSLSYSPFSPSL